MNENFNQVQAAGAPSRGYWQETQQPIYSAILVLPFILVYQTGLVLLKSKVVNGGDAILNSLTRAVFRAAGFQATFASVIVLIVAFLFWQYRKKGTWTVRPPMLAAMFCESLIYAVLLFMLLGFIVPYLPGSPRSRSPVAPHACRGEIDSSARPVLPAMAASERDEARRPGIEDFVLYCGAGVYEELVFRVLLLGLLMLVFTRLFHMEHAHAAAWSVVIGAAIFSAFHHIGGEQFALGVFLTRVLAGVYFASIYFTRSFGVAAASHALYDILVGLSQWRH
jgi:membrane protease YdiL (CAAX protease family)